MEHTIDVVVLIVVLVVVFIFTEVVNNGGAAVFGAHLLHRGSPVGYKHLTAVGGQRHQRPRWVYYELLVLDENAVAQRGWRGQLRVVEIRVEQEFGHQFFTEHRL